MKTFFRLFSLVTAWPIQLIVFKKRTFYESDKRAKKATKNGAIIITNHTNLILDYVLNMFTFAFRKLYCLVAEILYTHGKLLNFVLDCVGGIRVDRNTKELGFIERSVELLDKGKLLQVFPEGKIETEGKLLPFKSAYIMIALKSGKPIVPVVTDGNYGLFRRANVMFGDPIYLSDCYTGDNPTGDDVERLNKIVRDKFQKLRRRLEKAKAEKKRKLSWFSLLQWDAGRLFTFWFNLGLRVKVHGAGEKKKNLKIKGGYVIASNHIGLFDPVTLICTFWRRRLRILTGEVVFEGKPVREYFMKKLGCIKVDRNAGDADSIRLGVESIEDGYPLLVFPEGHIDESGGVTEMKSGAALMAAMTDKPILPVYIKKRTKWYGRTHVYLGDPITLEDGGTLPKLNKLEEYNAVISAAINDLKEKADGKK